MPQYQYSGKTIDGHPVTGTQAAPDATTLQTGLLANGVFLVSYRTTLTRLQQYLLKTFRANDLTKMTRQLQILLASGIAVAEALDLVSDQARDKRLQGVFASILQRVENGDSLDTAFRNYPILFDDLYVGMIRAGESSGSLDVAFERIASHREKVEDITRKVRAALAYPFLVLLVAVAVVFALVLYVVPVFSSMYQNFNAELPILTRQVIGLSDTLRERAWLWLGGGIFVLLIAGSMLATRRGKLWLHMMLVRTPLIRTLALKLAVAKFCRSLGSLLSAGVDILVALDIAARTTGNNYLSTLLPKAAEMLAGGKSLTESLESLRLFPRTVLRLTASGERSGQLGEMLSRAADYYEKETESEIATIVTLIEPVIIIVLGVLVAFILIAMYLPLFELVGAM